MEISMIDFDEEIRKFQPSLEVDEAEDAIYRNNTTDVTEVIDKIIREIKRPLSQLYKKVFGKKSDFK